MERQYKFIPRCRGYEDHTSLGWERHSFGERYDLILRTSRSAVLRSFSGFRVSHSQTTETRKPKARNSRIFNRSRFTFPLSFGRQYATLDFGFEARGHSRWQCQKHPWTKIAHRLALFAMSGLPGRSLTCFRNLMPDTCSSARTFVSGRVFSDRILDIISDRDRGTRSFRGGRSVEYFGDGIESDWQLGIGQNPPSIGCNVVARQMQQGRCFLYHLFVKCCIGIQNFISISALSD